MGIALVSFKYPGGYLYERQSVAMIGIHIGMNFKYKACELLFIGKNFPFLGYHRNR